MLTELPLATTPPPALLFDSLSFFNTLPPLDGIHPTTISYGIVAQEPINIMQLYAGVKFYLGDGITERTGFIGVDFERLIA